MNERASEPTSEWFPLLYSSIESDVQRPEVSFPALCRTENFALRIENVVQRIENVVKRLEVFFLTP